MASRSSAMTRREWLGVLGVSGMAGLSPLSSPARALVRWSPSSPPMASSYGVPHGTVVRAILEDMRPEDVGKGAVLFHEHLSIDMPPARPVPGGSEGSPTSNVELIVEEVKAAARDGVSLIVDAGHQDMGRNLENLRTISRQTGMPVVASGGYYAQRTYPADLASKSESQLAEELARQASQERWGAFGEIGQSSNAAAMTVDERKVFRAVGAAQVATRLPIFTHNPYGSGPNVPKDVGLRQLDVLESGGAVPSKIAIGHCCCLADPNATIIKQIAKRGAYVGIDRVTLERYVSDDLKLRMVLAFVDAGFADKLLLSSDFDGQPTLEGPAYARTLTMFVPKLKAAGVSDALIHQFIVVNPLRFLAFVPVAG